MEPDAAAFVVEDEYKEPRRKPKNWLKRNDGDMPLLKELEEEEPTDLTNYLRIESQTYDMILQRIRGRISKLGTRAMITVSAGERLYYTLGFLATGE